MNPVSSARWAARGIHTRLVCRILLLAFCNITPFMFIELANLPGHAPTDYFAFRSYAQFTGLYPPALIYNNQLLGAFQIHQLHGRFLPYLYHPGMLLLVWPLAHVSYDTGWILWIGLAMLAYAVAVGIAERNPAALVATLVAPSTVYTAWCGQSTLLAAALMFGGFRLLPRRPLLAGLLFGLLTYKPQLGILVPVALFASGQWRAIAAACGTIILIVLATAAAFGWSVWTSWIQDLPAIGQFMPGWMHQVAPTMATVTSLLMLLGMAPYYISVIQLITAFMAIAVVWMCFRRGTDMLGAAAVGVATFLATPYALGYDMPILTAAIIVIANERWQRHGTFHFLEIATLAAGFLLPVCVDWPRLFRFSTLVILALLFLVVHRIWRRDAVTARAMATPCIPDRLPKDAELAT